MSETGAAGLGADDARLSLRQRPPRTETDAEPTLAEVDAAFALEVAAVLTPEAEGLPRLPSKACKAIGLVPPVGNVRRLIMA